MEFGKLQQVDSVQFLLPEISSSLPRTEGTPDLFVGATGYNMKDWVGSWYPFSTKTNGHLLAYGKQFNTIEHNTTHYRIPDSETIHRWITETPSDFRFCPKIPQVISHARDLGVHNTELRLFWERMTALSPRLGVCFLQLPPHFEPRNLPVLSRFLDTWPSHLPLAVEVRHPLFFATGPEQDRYFELLTERQTGAVVTDVAGRRDVCHGHLTAPFLLVRFVGNSLHPSDFTRIDDWASQLKKWVQAGASSVYFFTHEPDNLLAPELAQYTVEKFRKVFPESKLRGPEPCRPPGEQGALF